MATLITTNKNKAVFFDRDGTLNVDIAYLHRPEDFIWIEGAKEAIKYVNDKGYLAVLVTNQSGVARGFYPEKDVKTVYAWMNNELAKIGAHLDALFYCPHHPDGKIPQYTKSCTCRKPGTGMIDDACKKFNIDRSKSFFIGDSAMDMECARRARIKGVHYQSGSLLASVKEVVSE
ncbi:HAD family hydrolase [Selenomonas sp.]|uniref:D-glycero-alpha-D-manno-heptose-1,7-bisphosphate 7-phosphatase n=1 Tax=Selenomonas sp. TaxID=2053611 RepID=UPI0025FEDB91|nr:HAD family hydrolase [Selenomonas sp.]